MEVEGDSLADYYLLHSSLHECPGKFGAGEAAVEKKSEDFIMMGRWSMIHSLYILDYGGSERSQLSILLSIMFSLLPFSSIHFHWLELSSIVLY